MKKNNATTLTEYQTVVETSRLTVNWEMLNLVLNSARDLGAEGRWKYQCAIWMRNE